MATKLVILDQLLKIVRQTNEIDLDHVVEHVNSRRVNISVDEVLLMDVSYSFTQLPKYAKDLLRGKLSLAEGLPVLLMVWSLLHEQYYTALHFGGLDHFVVLDVEQVWMLETTDYLRYLMSLRTLLLVDI